MANLSDAVSTQSYVETLSLYHDELSDEALIQALVAGAEWAMESLYQRYSTLLYSLTCRMVIDRQVAEDLLQDVFLAIWQHAESYTPQAGTVRNWLISIARHRAIDYLRSTRRHRTLKEIAWEEAEWDERAALPDVWEEAWCSMQRSQIQACLTKLLDEQRMAIELAYFHGWTQAEISERCQIPLGTVKARIRLGLLHLKRELEKRGLAELQ